MLRWLNVVAWVVTVLLAIVALLRIFAHDATMVLVWLNSATLYLYLPAYVFVLGAMFKRKWALVGFSGFVVLCHLVWILPFVSMLPPANSDIPEEDRFRIFSSNLLMVNPSPAPIIDEIKESNADVLLFQEYSPLWSKALTENGVIAKYPQYEGIIRNDSFGTAIMSKLPMTNGQVFDVAGVPMTRGSIEVAGREVLVINVHTLPPRLADYTVVWHEQMGILVETVRNHNGPLVVVGDFNATQHSAWYQRLISTGLKDCHCERGRGLATTFPNGLFPLPPLRLDHAFVSSEIACIDIKEGEGQNSDHRPLIVDLGLLDAPNTQVASR